MNPPALAPDAGLNATPAITVVAAGATPVTIMPMPDTATPLPNRPAPIVAGDWATTQPARPSSNPSANSSAMTHSSIGTLPT